MKAVIEQVFSGVLEQLVASGYVKLENYFLNGSKIEADANKSKVVWEKRKERYKDGVKARIKNLLEVIEAENAAEEAEYGEKDLEEKGNSGQSQETSEGLKKKMEEVNTHLRGEGKKATQAAVKQLEKDCLPRLAKYEEQERILAGRKSFAKTDPDATCMKMKEDRGSEKAWPKPAYNVQAGTEGQFIVGFSVHQSSSDPTCLIQHMERVRAGLGKLPQNLVTDAAYGSEENYVYAKKNQTGNYLKYTTFYQDTHHYRKKEIIEKHQF